MELLEVAVDDFSDLVVPVGYRLLGVVKRPLSERQGSSRLSP